MIYEQHLGVERRDNVEDQSVFLRKIVRYRLFSKYRESFADRMPCTRFAEQ